MRDHITTAIVSALLCVIAVPQANAAFGGQPPLKSDDSLRRLLAPYDLVKLNYLGANYCENLFDMRQNILSYSHMGFDTSNADAWPLQYPDDMGRFMEGITWESEFSPVVRLELMRRMTKGLMSAHIPGTRGYHSFRHRNGGKIYLILDDEYSAKDGRVTLSTFADSNVGMLRIGFRTEKAGKWTEIEQFARTDEPAGAGNPGITRTVENWNKSPYVFKRHYTSDARSADFTGKYWLSDEDMPLEYGFTSTDADRLQIVVGEPDRPMAMMTMMGDTAAPGVIHLPDRKTTFSSDADGDKVFTKPDFNYLIVRKKTAWGTWGFSAAAIVMWEGRPEKVEALKENGYGQIRVSYARENGKAGGRVWLYPFPWVDQDDMEHLYRNAEHFLKDGKLMLNSFPSPDFVNAGPAGLAAGAYFLTKYNDPLAVTARIRAQNAVDELFDGEKNGKKLMRCFFAVRAAAWMVKAGKALGDQRMTAKYTALVDIAVKRLLSAQQGYDGKTWPGGWDHFNSTKSLWLAYDATGNEEYKQAWERALTVYTIDEQGIYRYGKKLDAPGGFDTYFGAMPLGAWGHAGMLDNVNKLINLDVAAGWQADKLPAKNLFHDTGCGPWSQDDADPEYVGLSLRGANIPRSKQYVIPVDAFPIYDATGKVELTHQPLVENPFHLPGRDKVRVVSSDKPAIPHDVTTLTVNPGSEAEKEHLISPAGELQGSRRVCTGTDAPLVYRFDTKGAIGVGADMSIRGDGFKVEVSPDGKRWYQRLDTWSPRTCDQSIDISFLTGSRDELLKTDVIVPSNDGKYLVEQKGTMVDDYNRRYIAEGGSFVYRLDQQDAVDCRLEILIGNGYKVECSADGKRWSPGIDATQTKGGKDAAWIRMLDVSKYLKSNHTVYLRFSNTGDLKAFDGQGAFLRRITVYTVFDSGQAFVRLSNVSEDAKNAFALSGLTFRKWTN